MKAIGTSSCGLICALLLCVNGQSCFFRTPSSETYSVRDNFVLSTVSVETRDYVLTVEVFPTSEVRSSFDTSIINLFSTSGAGLVTRVPSLRFSNSSLRLVAEFAQGGTSATLILANPLPLLVWSTVEVTSCGQAFTLKAISPNSSPDFSKSLRAGLGVETQSASTLLPFRRDVSLAVQLQAGEPSIPATAAFIRNASICSLDSDALKFCKVSVQAPTPEPQAQFTKAPSGSPTARPTLGFVPIRKTLQPTTQFPTDAPTEGPTELASQFPSDSPVEPPSGSPTAVPSAIPTVIPTSVPTSVPSAKPTLGLVPIRRTLEPTTLTANPTETPTEGPTSATSVLSVPGRPGSQPTSSPTATPTNVLRRASDVFDDFDDSCLELRQARHLEAVQIKPRAVESLNLTAYLGFWLQLYDNAPVLSKFEKQGFCVSAWYSPERLPNGLRGNNATVHNAQRLGSPQGPISSIDGYISQPDGSRAPGQLLVHFQTPVVENVGDYWILALGPLLNGSYEWALVSSNTTNFANPPLFVLARDAERFDLQYKFTALALAKSLGFTGVLQPRRTYQGPDCGYDELQKALMPMLHAASVQPRGLAADVFGTSHGEATWLRQFPTGGFWPWTWPGLVPSFKQPSPEPSSPASPPLQLQPSNPPSPKTQPKRRTGGLKGAIARKLEFPFPVDQSLVGTGPPTCSSQLQTLAEAHIEDQIEYQNQALAESSLLLHRLALDPWRWIYDDDARFGFEFGQPRARARGLQQGRAGAALASQDKGSRSKAQPQTGSAHKPEAKPTVKPTAKTTAKPTVKLTVKATVKSTVKPMARLIRPDQSKSLRTPPPTMHGKILSRRKKQPHSSRARTNQRADATYRIAAALALRLKHARQQLGWLQLTMLDLTKQLVALARSKGWGLRDV